MAKCLRWLCFSIVSGLVFAYPAVANGEIVVNTNYVARVVSLFKEIAQLASEPGTSSANTTCGYIFPGDPNKFGCKGSGRAAADVAAACSGGGQLACTGSGSNRTCTCAFD